MGFVIEKLVSRLLFPVPLLLLLLALGWLLWAKTTKVRWGKTLVALAIVLLTLISSGPVADGLLATLESRYPVLHEQPEDVTHVVVLGGGADYVDGTPPSLCLSDSARARAMEGVRLFRSGDSSTTLVFTGYGGNGPVSIAELGAEAAQAMGVPEDRIITIDSPRNTREEAAAVVDRIGATPLVLVTSASHLPRAMAEFRLAGGQPIAAPAQFLAGRADYARSPWDWFPNGTAMLNTERAVYEYLGLAWMWVRRAFRTA